MEETEKGILALCRACNDLIREDLTLEGLRRLSGFPGLVWDLGESESVMREVAEELQQWRVERVEAVRRVVHQWGVPPEDEGDVLREERALQRAVQQGREALQHALQQLREWCCREQWRMEAQKEAGVENPSIPDLPAVIMAAHRLTRELRDKGDSHHHTRVENQL